MKFKMTIQYSTGALARHAQTDGIERGCDWRKIVIPSAVLQ